MRRAPLVLAATAAGTGALLAFHPRQPAHSAGTSGKTTVAGGRTITGSAQSTQYGPVQVRVTVRGGRVVDITAVQLPGSDPRSSQISSYAAPQLRQEALTAQSASIDAISGATYTSAGYQASLQAALDTAGL